MSLINHGMGFMTQKEHDELLKLNALICHGSTGFDAIHAEYPKLIVKTKSGDENSIDMGGNLFQLTQERDTQIKNGLYARIEYFPRAYTEYINKKWARDKAYEEQCEAMQSL